MVGRQGARGHVVLVRRAHIRELRGGSWTPEVLASANGRRETKMKRTCRHTR